MSEAKNSMTAENEVPFIPDGVGLSSPWRRIGRRFRRQGLVWASAVFVMLLCGIALFAEFLAPFHPEQADPAKSLQAPQALYLFDYSPDLVWRPHVVISGSGAKAQFAKRKVELGLLVRGSEYRLLGVFPSDLHLWGPKDKNEMFFVLGADRAGRDLLSRLVHGARFTLSVGLISVILSVLIGLLVGLFSAYCGGWVDWSIQRLIEHVLSLPAIPIWLAMVAALPRPWPAHYQYLAVAIIIALVGWTHQARVVRRYFLLMRGATFIKAARLDGCSEFKLIFRYMLPEFMPHLVVVSVLALSAMILAETTLSFLGLGLQGPANSWGVLLRDAQDVRAILSAPCLLFIPGAMVILTVLSLSFVGEGLRQAAESYEQ